MREAGRDRPWFTSHWQTDPRSCSLNSEARSQKSQGGNTSTDIEPYTLNPKLGNRIHPSIFLTSGAAEERGGVLAGAADNVEARGGWLAGTKQCRPGTHGPNNKDSSSFSLATKFTLGSMSSPPCKTTETGVPQFQTSWV